MLLGVKRGGQKEDEEEEWLHGIAMLGLRAAVIIAPAFIIMDASFTILSSLRRRLDPVIQRRTPKDPTFAAISESLISSVDRSCIA
jgi:hypothetical protein